MNYEQLLSYLETNWPKTSLKETVRDYPFDRLRALLACFGSPELHGEFVGVTGSKGKGSIARIVTDVVRAHGLSVGLFTSPHLVRLEERIELNGRLLEPEAFAQRFGAALDVQRAAGLKDLGITALLLAMALSYFRDESSDLAVLEVRAGGRYDPTNVVSSSTVGIGPIGLEHVPGLGRSVAEIAWQKVGLVTPGGVCYSSEQALEAERVLEEECAAIGAELRRFGRDFDYRVTSRTERGQTLNIRTPGGMFRDLPLALLGEHQAANAALAVSVAEHVLQQRRRSLKAPALAKALAAVRWPARLERLNEKPLLLYDGAHTAESAAALTHALGSHFPGQRWSLILGVLTGKDAGAMLEALQPIAARARFVPVTGFNHQSPESLAELARARGLDAAARPSLAAALNELEGNSEPICVTGSLYLYGPTLEALRRVQEG